MDESWWHIFIHEFHCAPLIIFGPHASNMTMAADDGGFQVQQSRNKAIKKRIYIGNLPQKDGIKSKLVDFMNEKAQLAISSNDVTIVRQGSAALVTCQDVNRAMSQLNNVEFQGNKLVVQREKKKRPSNNAKKQSPLGGGWNRPTLSFKEPQEESCNEEDKTELTNSNAEEKAIFVDPLELSQHLGSIVASKLKAAEEDPSNGDVVNTMIASTAAMSLLSSTKAFGLDQNSCNDDQTVSPEDPVKTAVDPTVAYDGVDDDDFMSRAKKPLAELLADYGEQDLDFKKVVPTISTEEEETPMRNESRREDFNNRLTLQGKAPIHVEVMSFGFIHGVPSDVRSGGWSYSHPLSPLDCRDLPQVPQYMARQDGLSPAVKRVLKNAQESDNDSKRNYRVQEYANELGQQMFDALYEAITAGGYGHASPLRMTVYVGSESGRHRSVVVCELAATALRKLLRSNHDNRISQPVSVGTRHRDIERRHQQQNAERARPKQLQIKQKEFESEW